MVPKTMQAHFCKFARISLALCLLSLVSQLCATSVPRLTLEQLIAESELIVTGHVLRSWSAWDRSHRFIWTHYAVAARDLLEKNARLRTLTVSEPGGIVDGVAMRMQGAVQFTPGQETVLFLYKTPIGYLRTVGYGQGKYTVGPDQRIRRDVGSIDLVDTGFTASKSGATSLSSLEGVRLTDLRVRVASLSTQKRSGAR